MANRAVVVAQSGVLNAVWVALALMAGATAVSAQASVWCRYGTSTLDSLHAKALRESIADTMTIASNDYASRVPARYTGDVRAIASETAAFIRMAAGYEVSDRFREEARFMAGQFYWLPIQHEVLTALRREARNGDSVTLFVVWSGSRFSTEAMPVVLVNEFSGRQSAPHWTQLLKSCPR